MSAPPITEEQGTYMRKTFKYLMIAGTIGGTVFLGCSSSTPPANLNPTGTGGDTSSGPGVTSTGAKGSGGANGTTGGTTGTGTTTTNTGTTTTNDVSATSGTGGAMSGDAVCGLPAAPSKGACFKVPTYAGNGSGGGGGSGGGDGGVKTCGDIPPGIACNDCVATTCCAEYTACENDAACKLCLSGNPPASCANNALNTAYTMCSTMNCNDLCIASTCNPVTNEGCANDGTACDVAPGMDAQGAGRFSCFAPPNDTGLCGMCDEMAGPYCKPGSTCAGSMGTECALYCCDDGDCGKGKCDKTILGMGYDTIGVCLVP